MPPTKVQGKAKPRKAVSKAERARRAEQREADQPATPPPDLGRAGNWQRGSNLGTEELHLPSGSTCVVLQQPGLESLVKNGVIDRMDILTSFVDRELVQPAKRRGKKEEPASMSNEDLLKLMQFADRVTVAMCVDPPVQLAPTPKCKVCGWEGANVSTHTPEDEHTLDLVPRNPRFFYTDGIDLQDKMEILRYAIGGPQNVEPFPERSSTSVEAVDPVEELQVQAE